MINIQGCHKLSFDKSRDGRGSFSRLICTGELEKLGIKFEMVQSSLSFSYHAGTMRGLHLQNYPKGEGKVVVCLRGKVLLAVVDLRGESETFRKVDTLVLSSPSDPMEVVYIPEYCALGYQTLEDNTEILYMMDEYYDEDLQTGINCFDKSLDIPWRKDLKVIMSEKDKNLDMLPFSCKK